MEGDITFTLYLFSQVLFLLINVPIYHHDYLYSIVFV